MISSFSAIRSYSQLIEKAPPSPVTVIAPPSDTVNALISISDIIITGYKKTKPYIIQREVPFKKGEYLLYSKLHEKLSLCKQQLMNTTLFVDVDVKPVALDSSHIFIFIDVKERWYLFPIPYFKIVSRNFNTWWVEEDHNFNRVEYGLKFMQNNVSGRNDHLNLWFISGFTQQFSLRYDNPNIDNKLKHGINIGFGFRRNRELNYGMDSTKPNKIGFVKQDNRFIIKQNYVDFAYTYRPAIRTRHTIKASYASIGIDDLVLKLNPNYLASQAKRLRYADLSYNLSYSNLDYIPYPLKGFAGDATIYKRFGKNANMWQLSGRGNYNIKFSPTSFIQLQATGLLRFPFNQPYISNGLMGSTDFYMRGLEYYVIEGVAGGVARATVKKEILSFNLRNPIASKTYDKIPFRVFLKGYVDLGYSYTPNYGISRLNNRLLRTWGAGIDIVTFYDIVLRFEYSFNQLGDQGLFFHTQNDW
ncbi:POTRA domain-containing protein [Segetibacter koreensis]|uniref:POTRA domain-containing protein n=1 Tax=Segetibacter koreensis TaxID=398037 RepID=UPI00035DDF1A|nr:POTRA domain-containing protein [Segetibacter koreensis]